MAIKFLDEEQQVQGEVSNGNNNPSSVRFLDDMATQQPVREDEVDLSKLSFKERVISGIENYVERQGQLGARAINSALGGLPQKFLRDNYPQIEKELFTNPTGFLAKAENTIADLQGFALGPLKAGAFVASKVPAIAGKAISTGALRGGVEFGVGSALATPESEELSNIKSRLLRTTTGAFAGLLFGAASTGLGNFKKALDNEVKIGEKIRGSIKDMYKQRSENFESGLYKNMLESDFKKVAIGDVKEKLQLPERMLLNKMASKNDEIATALNSSEGLSLKQFQQLINNIKSKMSNAKLSGKGLRASDKTMDNLIDGLQKSKESFFPGMREVDTAYKAMTENLNVFKNLKLGNTTSSMRSALANKEKKEVLQSLLPPDLFREVESLVMGQSLSKTGIATVREFIRYGIIYQMLRNQIGNKITGTSLGGPSGD